MLRLMPETPTGVLVTRHRDIDSATSDFETRRYDESVHEHARVHTVAQGLQSESKSTITNGGKLT